MGVEHYQGGCQCGAVRYTVDVDLASTVTCNCSRCQRLGSVLAFTTDDKFKLVQGEEHLTEYLFNKGGFAIPDATPPKSVKPTLVSEKAGGANASPAVAAPRSAPRSKTKASGGGSKKKSGGGDEGDI